jgi:hypothetical protein
MMVSTRIIAVAVAAEGMAIVMMMTRRRRRRNSRNEMEEIKNTLMFVKGYNELKDIKCFVTLVFSSYYLFMLTSPFYFQFINKILFTDISY